MNSDFIYHPNTSRITYEIIEGEVIIVDFETGVYYSINALGTVIFNWIVQGVKLGTMLAAIEKHYSDANTDLVQTFNSFMTALLQNGIIERSETTINSVSELEPTLEGLPDTVTFVPPKLDKYTDMQELLLLDPIHEVDEKGWPFVQHDDNKPVV
jgi:hypothetical protein